MGKWEWTKSPRISVGLECVGCFVSHFTYFCAARSKLPLESACNQPELGQDWAWLRKQKVLVLRLLNMKVTDDYKAKTRLWAEHPKVVAPTPGPPLPRFKAMKFRTHMEMNHWKAALLREIADDRVRHG